MGAIEWSTMASLLYWPWVLFKSLATHLVSIHVTDVTLHIMITAYTNDKVIKLLVNFALLAQPLI